MSRRGGRRDLKRKRGNSPCVQQMFLGISQTEGGGSFIFHGTQTPRRLIDLLSDAANHVCNFPRHCKNVWKKKKRTSNSEVPRRVSQKPWSETSRTELNRLPDSKKIGEQRRSCRTDVEKVKGIEGFARSQIGISLWSWSMYGSQAHARQRCCAHHTLRRRRRVVRHGK